MKEDAMVWTDGDLAVLGCICAYKDIRAARPAVRALKARYRRVEVPTVTRLEMVALLVHEGFTFPYEDIDDEPRHPFLVWEE